MTKILIKLFIKDYQNTDDPTVRQKYGLLSGTVGIILNTLLAIFKFIIGTFVAHSIAISADAVNNFSDAASSVLTIIGFKIAGKHADDNHPFGHGRFETIIAFIVGIIVMFMGTELISLSVEKIKTPSQTVFSFTSAGVLLLSVFGKIWLALFNRYLGKKIQSEAMSAVVADSISDSTSTAIALFSLIFSLFSDVAIDGWAGILVALFILYTGFGILKQTIGILLGTPPNEQLVKTVVNHILSNPNIKGVHDLMIHNYGTGNIFGTIHAEVSADSDLIEIHDCIDVIERELAEKFHIHMVIHLDPLVFDDERVNQLREMALKLIHQLDPTYSLHDFRVVEGNTHTNLIFDLVIPRTHKKSEREIRNEVEALIHREDPRYYAVVTVEHSFVNS